MKSEAAVEAEVCGSVLLLRLPDDVLELISGYLRPRDLCALALCCRGLRAAVGGSEKVWLAQCRLIGPPPHLLPRWRRGVRSYRALCRFLAAVAPLLGIWVHQNPELGNVVCVVWGFLSVVGVRVIPQEIGPLGLDGGTLLWAPVFEILSDANGSPSRFFLHGRDGGEDCVYPGSVHSIDSSSNVLFLEADVRLKDYNFHQKPFHLPSARSFSAVSESTNPKFARKYRRSHTAVLSRSSFPLLIASPSSPPFSQLPFSDRRRLLDFVAARIRLRVPRDLAPVPLFERSPFRDDANLLADRRLELIEMLKLNCGWIDRKPADFGLGSIEHRNAVCSDRQPSAVTDSRKTFSLVAWYLKQFLGRDTPPTITCSISRNGDPLGGSKKKHAQLHEFLGSGDVIGLSLRATHMRLTTYRAWPNMYDNRFALYKLPIQVPAAGRELAGLWGGTFGWPLGWSSEGRSGKALFFLLLSYEEVEGHLLLTATKILEGSHYVLHPNGSAMFIVKMDEMTPEPFPWENDGESLEVEVKSCYSGEGIANGYGFRYPGSKPGMLFVLRNGLLAFVWSESNCVLTLQKVELQELLKKGERVPALPPIANFAYLTKSYSNVFTGLPTYSAGARPLRQPTPTHLCCRFKYQGLLCKQEADVSKRADPKSLLFQMAEERKPLSLNERNARLLDGLSRSRPRHPNPKPSPESAVRKVKIEGRRRLCKVASSSADAESPSEKWLDSPPAEEDDCGNAESIRDILDDLTARMDSLSVQKPPKPREKPVEPEPYAEYESATSSLSPSSVHSSPDSEKDAINREREVKGAATRGLSLDDVDEEDGDCVVLGSNGKAHDPKGKEVEDESHDFWGDDDATNLDGDNDEDVASDDFTMAGTGNSRSRTYRLPQRIFKMLYPHQRDGLKWLWALHCGNTGGILGDDMGLGKTMQVSAFLAGLFCSHFIKKALIVAPKTLLGHWMKELSVVGLSEKTRDYSGTNATHRQYELQYVLKEGGILLTTYDIVRNNTKSIRGDWFTDRDVSEEDIIWDYTVLDEGHIIKNPKTQRSKSISDIPSAHRVIISGTPIQNNLKELWALFNFCCPDVLGDKDTFKIRYEHPILRGNDKNASDREKHIGSTVAKELRERIQPYFLRRLKSEVFSEDDATESAKLSKKSEMIVWLKLTACQRQLYEAFLKSELVHSSMEGSPLAALTILKKICDHPLLLTKRAAEGVLEGMDSMLNREELGMVENMAMNLANMTEDGFLPMGQNVSCKISFIMSLLTNLVEEGHVVLIFSQTRKMLNLLQEAITSEGYEFLRIDGATKLTEREKIVKDFQEGFGAPIFLLTSQVGGLGLTLTRADRVIVVDPAWNPSTDNQSVDRAYRIGQKNDVVVYRLMTCGTIEEKIYKMQVFKGGLFKTATEHKEQTRYFSQKDIRELFSLPAQGFDVSLTQQQLQEEHDRQHNLDDHLTKHIEFLQQLGIAGVSHHSLLFSKTAVVPPVQETDEVQRMTVNRVIRNSRVDSSNEVEYAFNPKDNFISRTYSPNLLPKDGPEEIQSKINRLSQTLGNKALVAKLPDSGDRIRKQISDLQLQLNALNNPSTAPTIPRAEAEVICIDDVTDELNRISV